MRPRHPASAATSETYTWQNAFWGGGRFVTGTLFHPKVQGLAYARTDVGGLYRRDPGSTKWVPLNDGLTRPDADLHGVLSMAVDVRDPGMLYMATGMYLPWWGHKAAIFRSADRGKTWARTDLPISPKAGPRAVCVRGRLRRAGPGASYPALLVAGVVDGMYGVWRSDDQGAHWIRITDAAHEFGAVNTLAGDRLAHGKVYLGAACRSVMIGSR